MDRVLLDEPALRQTNRGVGEKSLRVGGQRRGYGGVLVTVTNGYQMVARVWHAGRHVGVC